MAMEAMVDTVSATPLAMVLATAMAVTARGLPTLRLMPTTAMEDMVDMVLAMEAMVDTVLTTAMEDMVDTVLATPPATVLATDTVVTERGPLILRPTPTMVMADMVDTDSASMESLPHV